MRIPISSIPEFTEEAIPILNNILSKMCHAINNIEFGTVSSSASENIWCSIIVIDTNDWPGESNVPMSAFHGLNRIPIGRISIWQDKSAVFYNETDPSSADTSNIIFYRCNTAATSAVLLLI